MNKVPFLVKPVPEVRPGVSRFSAWALWMVFALALLVPLAKTDFSNTPQASATEKRNLALFPKWSWRLQALQAFPSGFEAAFNDHFGFRMAMVRTVSRLKVRWGLSILPKPNVVLGRDGWLYLSETIKEVRGLVTKGTPAQADAWARYIRVKNEWLAARGVRYLFVIIPNKEWVYPEHLPKGISPAPGLRFSDQLMRRLEQETNLPVLDLRQMLVDAKPQGLIFDRTDTHWSQLGAFLATNRILECLHEKCPDLGPGSLAAHHPYAQTGPGGDLAIALCLPDLLPETRLMIEPLPGAWHKALPHSTEVWPKSRVLEPVEVLESNLPEGRRNLLLVGNSFTQGVLRFLPEHFRRVVRLRPQIPYETWFHEQLPGIINAEKPDFYIEVLSERHLYKAPEPRFPEVP
jgi:alginate O-acetyltransferase complex protein AlgJ